MVWVRLLLLSLVAVEGFRIRRSEDIALSDIIDNEKRNTERQLAEVLDLIPSETRVVLDTAGKTTPSPLHSLPSPTAVYPVAPTFQGSLPPPQFGGQHYQHPGQSSTFRPQQLVHPSPSYFPFGHPTPYHPQVLGVRYQPTPPPNPYIPLLYTPAITFLDESPSSDTIQVTPRSFTPQPTIIEVKTKVPQPTSSLAPQTNGPPEPALLTIGLQSDPAVNTKQEFLPQDSEDSTEINISNYDINYSDENLTAVSETDEIPDSPSYGDIDKVLESILEEPDTENDIHLVLS